MNAQSLLDALLQANPAGATQSRINHAAGPQGLASPGGPLAGILGGLAETAGGLFNVGRERVQRGDPAAIGGLGALAGLLRGGRGGAVGGGALALLGSLAYSGAEEGRRRGGAGVGGTVGAARPRSACGRRRARRKTWRWRIPRG